MSKKDKHWYHLTIRARIYLGYGFLSCLLLLVGAIALWGVHKHRVAITEFGKLNTDFALQEDINASTKDIQRHVVRYMHEGYKSAGFQVLEEMDALGLRINKHMGERQHMAEINMTLLDIKERLETYRSTFKDAFDERQVYTELIDFQLPNLAREIKELFLEFHLKHGHEHPVDHALWLLSESQEKMHAYFTTKDYSKARQSEEFLAEIKAWIDEFQSGIDHHETEGEFNEIKSKLTELERLSNRAVQATRAYLFLINVVMSAEAAEMLYQTDALRNAGKLRQDQMNREIKELSNSVTSVIFILVIGTVFGGLGYVILTTHKITTPISAISRTFVELSKGRKVDHIPGSENMDEIGDLALAANVFRERNEQTQTLLLQADELTRDLKEKTRQLEASNSEMEQFVYTVSHDLKSPIVTSMGFIGIIKDLAAKGKFEEAISRLHRVEEANQRMSALINDLLDLSRVGRVEDQFRPVDTGKVLRSLCSRMETFLQEHSFEVSLTGDFPVILGTESRFGQIFENLVTNAVKYGKAQDGGTDRVEISFSTDEKGGRYIFAVRDYGIGISVQFREKIFALFSRLNHGVEGSGVGLAIVRKLARLHGGDVWVDSPQGSGALFKVAFPIPSQIQPIPS